VRSAHTPASSGGCTCAGCCTSSGASGAAALQAAQKRPTRRACSHTPRHASTWLRRAPGAARRPHLVGRAPELADRLLDVELAAPDQRARLCGHAQHLGRPEALGAAGHLARAQAWAGLPKERSCAPAHARRPGRHTLAEADTAGAAWRACVQPRRRGGGARSRPGSRQRPRRRSAGPCPARSAARAPRSSCRHPSSRRSR